MPKLPRSITAWVARAAIQVLAREADRFYPNETGGILIGYWDESMRNVVITIGTRSGCLARHASLLYAPDAEHDEAEIAKYYKASEGVYTYLGDWHTHPNETSYLSGKDFRTLALIAQTPGARIANPLMAVLGGKPNGWELHIWCYEGRWRRVRALPVNPFDA